jgi:hypothetical protein
MACLGADARREATSDALAYGWERWERVKLMDNAVDHPYVVGRDLGRRSHRRWDVVFPAGPERQLPWVEPGLNAALSTLSERERTVVLLIHGYGWEVSEVATSLSQNVEGGERAARRGSEPVAGFRSRLLLMPSWSRSGSGK